MIDDDHDDLPTPEDLERLARSLAMDHSLPRSEALRVVSVLRWASEERGRRERLG